MGKQPTKSVEDKTRIVLSVLRGEISKWRDQFLAGGQRALTESARHGPSGGEQALAAEIEELTSALARLTWSCVCGAKGGSLPGFADLEVERVTAGLTVTRFCEVTGIPRPTWYRWRAAALSSKGPWPTPTQDRIEADAKELAALWEGWGHRKIAELLRTDPDRADASDSTVYRVLDRSGLTLPPDYTGEVRQLAGVRKETPSRRRHDETGCGRPTSPTSRPPAQDRGASAGSSTTGPRPPSRVRCRRPRRPRARSRSSKLRSPRSRRCSG